MLVAVAGFAAVALRAVGALLLVVRFAVDAFLARDLADARARRGDLTGVSDAAGARALARRRRLAAVGALCTWGSLLIVPPLTSWPTLLYASYSLLWLLPRRRTAVQHT
ncbi:hypothetical protein BH23GEM10_BH23GEM10_11500 [soil metagenome]